MCAALRVLDVKVKNGRTKENYFHANSDRAAKNLPRFILEKDMKGNK